MRFILLVFAVTMVAGAQTPQTSRATSTVPECADGHCTSDAAPLKCGKYQYVKTDDWVYVEDCKTTSGGKLECSPPIPRCEDKIYPMTLAEYERILARLKKLEDSHREDNTAH